MKNERIILNELNEARKSPEVPEAGRQINRLINRAADASAGLRRFADFCGKMQNGRPVDTTEDILNSVLEAFAEIDEAYLGVMYKELKELKKFKK